MIDIMKRTWDSNWSELKTHSSANRLFPLYKRRIKMPHNAIWICSRQWAL